MTAGLGCKCTIDVDLHKDVQKFVYWDCGGFYNGMVVPTSVRHTPHEYKIVSRHWENERNGHNVYEALNEISDKERRVSWCSDSFIDEALKSAQKQHIKEYLAIQPNPTNV